LRPIPFSSLYSLHSSPWPTQRPSPSSSSGQCQRVTARSRAAAPCTAVRHPSPRASGRIELTSRSLRFPSSLGANPLTSSPVTVLHLKTHYRHPAGHLPSPPPPPRPYIRQLCLCHLPTTLCTIKLRFSAPPRALHRAPPPPFLSLRRRPLLTVTPTREALGEALRHPLSLFPLSRRASAALNGRARSLQRERRPPWPPFHGGPVDHSRLRGPRDHEPGAWIFILKNNSNFC
jgi:hypothetical protein